MSKSININDSISVHPVGATGTSNLSASSSYPSSNACTDSNSDTYARYTVTRNTTGETYFTFDVQGVPAGATITSITATVKVYVNSTTYVTNTQCQLYSGTTAKGSNYTFASTSSSNVVSMTNTGTWTVGELADMRLKIGGTGNNSNNNKYIYVYGATVIINYSLSGTAYTITAASSVSGVTPTPATQDIMEGEDAEVRIDASSLDNLSITDNDIDISGALVQYQIENTNTANRVLGTYTLVSGSFNSNGATYFQGLVNKGVDNTKTTSNYYSSGSGTIAVFTYDMSFTDIPSNATITRVYCEVNGHAESTSNSNEYMCAQLISGTTNLSEELNFKSIGTSNSTQTIECTTTPTIAQLANMKLQCRLGYYGGAINGATCYVEYETPGAGGYYWTYTLTNLSDDHTIIIEEAGAYIPPEEDPEYTYESLTISSINAVTNPVNGTTRVITGSNQTITISPSDPQLTLALDNGVDITSQLIGGIPNNSYTITTPADADYGFNLNSSTGFYVSQNDGQAKSAAIARVNLELKSDCIVTFTYINYAEAGYDYGMFGKLDTKVAYDGLTASSGSSNPSDSTSNYQYICSNSSDNTNTQKTLSYNVPAGSHFIEVKYGKDDATDSGNDNLQFKVELEATSAGGDYTYTLNNINQKHSLVFVFGNVNYYFITSSGTGCRLFPDGQQVELEGESYRLNIVPNNITDTVTITDNNTDRTSLLIREDGYDKYNNPVVSYSYSLTNIQAAHNLVITCGTSNALYIKQNGNWGAIIKVYKKIDNRWVEQNLSYMSDNNIKYLKQG